MFLELTQSEAVEVRPDNQARSKLDLAHYNQREVPHCQNDSNVFAVRSILSHRAKRSARRLTQWAFYVVIGIALYLKQRRLDGSGTFNASQTESWKIRKSRQQSVISAAIRQMFFVVLMVSLLHAPTCFAYGVLQQVPNHFMTTFLTLTLFL